MILWEGKMIFLNVLDRMKNSENPWRHGTTSRSPIKNIVK